MDTTWKIVGTEGQFLVVEYTRGTTTIRQTVLHQPKHTLEEAILGNQPTEEQFTGVSAQANLSAYVGLSGTSKAKA